MPTVFDPVIRFLADLGIFDVLIPFMLSFTILYAVFQKTEILGKGQKNINTMVAFVMSAIFVAAIQLVTALTAIAQWSALALVFLLLAFMVGTLGGFTKWHATWPKVIILIIMVLIVITAFGAWDVIPVYWLTSAILPIIITFLLIVGYIWWMTGEKEPKKPKKEPKKEAPKQEPLSKAISPQDLRDLLR